MGLLDSVQGMAGQLLGGQAGDQAKVAGGLVEAAGQYPGGLGGIMDLLRNRGMNQHVEQWQTGQTSEATSEQVDQGLGGTGIIEQTASKAGVSPEMAKTLIAAVLPMVLAHFTQNGRQAPPSTSGDLSGMAGSLLSKLM